MDGMRGLDNWITSGRYYSNVSIVVCDKCRGETRVVMETEYGATEWSPYECSECKTEFTGDEAFFDDEPPDPEFDDE